MNTQKDSSWQHSWGSVQITSHRFCLQELHIWLQFLRGKLYLPRASSCSWLAVSCLWVTWRPASNKTYFQKSWYRTFPMEYGLESFDKNAIFLSSTPGTASWWRDHLTSECLKPTMGKEWSLAFVSILGGFVVSQYDFPWPMVLCLSERTQSTQLETLEDFCKSSAMHLAAC